jgi:hypothetical protein
MYIHWTLTVNLGSSNFRSEKNQEENPTLVPANCRIPAQLGSFPSFFFDLSPLTHFPISSELFELGRVRLVKFDFSFNPQSVLP